MKEYIDAIKKYAQFEGRETRKSFWMFVLYGFIISIILSILMVVVRQLIWLIWIYDLFILLPSLSIGARRLHDTGRTGWWLLIGLVPLIGIIVLIVFYCLDSQPGSNKYGPSVKEVSPPTTM